MPVPLNYDRYIDNKVIKYCRRPQRKDWCAPITVAEVVEILQNKYLSIDQIAKTMNWSPETITAGRLGTNAVVGGVQKVSGYKIKTKVMHPKDIEEHWKKIKKHIHDKGKVIYYHEPGHHLLICGYIEEPLVIKEDLWNHKNVGKSDYKAKRKWLIKAEHNIKKVESIDQGIFVPVEFHKVCQNVEEKKNSDIILFSI